MALGHQQLVGLVVAAVAAVMVEIRALFLLPIVGILTLAVLECKVFWLKPLEAEVVLVVLL